MSNLLVKRVFCFLFIAAFTTAMQDLVACVQLATFVIMLPKQLKYSTFSMFDLSQSVLFDLSQSVLLDLSQSVLFDLSQSVLFDLSQSVLFDLSQSVLFDLSQSVLFDLSQSVLFDLSQSVLGTVALRFSLPQFFAHLFPFHSMFQFQLVYQTCPVVLFIFLPFSEGHPYIS